MHSRNKVYKTLHDSVFMMAKQRQVYMLPGKNAKRGGCWNAYNIIILPSTQLKVCLVYLESHNLIYFRR